MIRYLIGALVILLAASVIAGLAYRGNAALAIGERDAAVTAQVTAEAERDNLRDVLTTERARADRMTRIAEQYEQDKTDAQAKADAVIADLRAGATRLQDKWLGCQAGMPPSFPGTSQLDAGAEDRAEGAAAIVRAAAECDAQVRGLQRVVMEDRQ